jgi:hypothetical protein
MTDFTVDSSSTGGIDTRWRASKHGQSEGRPGTLDISLFVSGTHYNITGSTYGTDIIPSGVAVGKVTATGLYGPFDNAASDGREVLAGFINDDQGIPVKRPSGATSAKSTFSRLVHGIIRSAVLPVSAQRAAVKAEALSSGVSFIFED